MRSAAKDIEVFGNGSSFCQNSAVVTFGYENPDLIMEKVRSGDFDVGSSDLPIILGVEVKDRKLNTSGKEDILACHDFLLVNENRNVFSSLKKDKVYDIHLQQGVMALYDYMLYRAKKDAELKNVLEWKNKSIKYIEEMESGGGQIKSSSPAYASNRNLQIDQNLMSLGSVAEGNNMDARGVEDDEASNLRAWSDFPKITMGVYQETYSTLAYASASKRELIFFEKTDVAIQHEVMSIVYGVDVVETIKGKGGVVINASSPSIIYRDTVNSDLGLFGKGDFSLMTKVHSKPVSEYLGAEIEKSRSEAIEKNSEIAKKITRNLFEIKVKSIVNDRGGEVHIRYDDMVYKSKDVATSPLRTFLAELGL